MKKPDINIFPHREVVKSDEEKSVLMKANKINTTMKNFKVRGKVVATNQGPVVTRFEIELQAGERVKSVTNLKDDLTIALKTKRINILAPIPGEDRIGIEVPNDKPETVYIRDILNTDAFNNQDMKIPIVLGFDVNGNARVTDLTKAPHLLVAGQTGSGKSVGVNSFLTSILFSRTPEQVELLLIDPKIVELSPYNGIPHLVQPVITETDKALEALKWACDEMDERYKKLSEVGVRNIESYNEKADDKMSYLVILVDEFADLMVTSGKQVEQYINRISAKARAIGMHLIVTTQRPTVDVVTGTIKANLPSRISFQTASQIDSRTILDRTGSENLVGRGDMLYLDSKAPNPERIHGSLVTDDEVEALVNHWKSQNITKNFDFSEPEEEIGDIDPSFDAVARLVVDVGYPSLSLIQRKMKFDYKRAEKLIKQLELSGVISPEMGRNPRELLMNSTQLKHFLAGGRS
ncbi:MAG: DNA translocase FtsK [Candidatus Hodarchaeales archaeon]